MWKAMAIEDPAAIRDMAPKDFIALADRIAKANHDAR
jgi:hypothetical protein